MPQLRGLSLASAEVTDAEKRRKSGGVRGRKHAWRDGDDDEDGDRRKECGESLGEIGARE